jgi:hypothetical protein
VPKREQDGDALVSEIQEAGNSILSIEAVRVSPAFLVKHVPIPIALCRSCGEAYVEKGSGLCLACEGKAIYI